MGEVAGPRRAKPQPVVRLVNLTEHDVAVESWPGSGDVADAGASPALLAFAPDWRPARVDDDAARTGGHGLDVGAAFIPVTRLRRSARLRDLPAPQPDTRYIVSRLTALAARHRSDLVFPFGEIRDSSGRITGVRGVAMFRSRWAVRYRFRDWRLAFRERNALQPLRQTWVTGVLFALATALLSGATGLVPGALDSARTQGWDRTWLSWTWDSGAGSAVLGVAFLVWAAMRWRKNQRILAQRGTAYVIDEQAGLWLHEEKESALADIGADFAATLLVPGPRDLGYDWDWRANEARAPHWDDRLDQLVNTFWAVHHNDSKITHNAVFVWAPWPVAMAFGARATAGHRGLNLHVRQRPSYGLGGPHRQPLVADGAHDFLYERTRPPFDETSESHQVWTDEKKLEVTFSRLEHRGDDRPSIPGDGETGDGGAGPAAVPPILLVVRIIHRPVGRVKEDLGETKPFAIKVCPDLIGDVIPAGPHAIRIAEWRLDARDGGSGRVPDLPWEEFPAAAQAIADWVIEQAGTDQRAGQGPTVLLATRMPQELAVGVGVQLRQRSGRDDQDGWPSRVYPAVFEAGGLAVPKLRLGTESVSQYRV